MQGEIDKIAILREPLQRALENMASCPRVPSRDAFARCLFPLSSDHKPDSFLAEAYSVGRQGVWLFSYPPIYVNTSIYRLEVLNGVARWGRTTFALLLIPGVSAERPRPLANGWHPSRMRASVSREQILPTGQLGNKKHDIGQNNHRAKPEILLSPGLG